MSPKIVGFIEIPPPVTLSKEQLVTLRRKVADKMCKDQYFCLEVIRLALKKHKIKHNDIVEESELQGLVLGNF